MISRKMASLIVLVILINVIVVTGKKLIDTRDAEIDRLLKKLNKPAIKSIKSPDGDIIDCVHMKNHPIYDHPLFKNHTIQMRPNSFPEGWKDKSSFTKKYSAITQLWTINGKCPENSIPIRRIRKEDILRAKSIKRFGKKDHNSIPQPKPANPRNENVTHEYALLSMNVNTPREKFYGAKAIINVWKPHVQPREFSVAQIWVAAGPNAAQINTIEAGWQVYPFMYGDDKPRFFIYWTADGYQTTGCYNLDCEGFVVTNQEFTIGGVISPVSTYDGAQKVLLVYIWKDHSLGHWWLRLGGHLIVGYWPSSLFNHLRNGATNIQWGGEIVDTRKSPQHTLTKMGSGHFAQEGLKKASYFSKIGIIDQANSTLPLERSHPYMTKPNCYNILKGFHPRLENFFFFGGPGRNPNCN